MNSEKEEVDRKRIEGQSVSSELYPNQQEH